MKLKNIIGLAALFVNITNGQVTNLCNTTNYIHPMRLTVTSCDIGDTIKFFTSWDKTNWIHGATWPIKSQIDRSLWFQMRWNGIDDTLWVGWPDNPGMVATTFGHIYDPKRIPHYKIEVSKDIEFGKLNVNSKTISIKK